MRVLLDAHFITSVDDARRLVVFKRKPTKLSASEVEAALAALGDVQRSVDRPSWHLLIDMRDGPLNNAPDFEAAMQRAIGGLIFGYRRRAVLLKTAVGVLQVQRTAREREGSEEPPGIFRDEVEAITWLLAP